MLIDFHTHAFPDELAGRALGALQRTIGFPPFHDGTVKGLIRSMDDNGVERSVICNIATAARQVEHVNQFAIRTAETYGNRLSPLGSIHPLFPHPEDEIERLRAAGIPGIKIHPDFMGVSIDDPAFDELFAAAADAGLFILTHAGFDVSFPDLIRATPAAILRRIRRSPGATLVCAHFGGNALSRDVIDTLLGEPVWIDTSLPTVSHLPKENALAILNGHDAERLLFGSDSPWCTPRETFEYVDSLPVPDDLKEKIFHRNACRLLGIS